jgi:hypothetical protein
MKGEGQQVPSPSTRGMGEHNHAEEWRHAGRHTADRRDSDPSATALYDRRWQSSATAAALVVEHGSMSDDGPCDPGAWLTDEVHHATRVTPQCLGPCPEITPSDGKTAAAPSGVPTTSPSLGVVHFLRAEGPQRRRTWSSRRARVGMAFCSLDLQDAPRRVRPKSPVSIVRSSQGYSRDGDV